MTTHRLWMSIWMLMVIAALSFLPAMAIDRVSAQPPATSGEDIGQPPGRGPLIPIAEEMQVSQVLVAQNLFNDNTRDIQSRIVARLAALVEQMQQAASSSDPQQDGQQQDGQQPGPQAGPATGEGGRAGAADSTPRPAGPNQQPDAAGTVLDVPALARRVWGHLPQRERDAMIQNMPEEFLPKYDREIQLYYQRLAEELPE